MLPLDMNVLVLMFEIHKIKKLVLTVLKIGL
jgi:hypothetical protein